MDAQKLVYDDVAAPGELAADCTAVERRLRLDLHPGSAAGHDAFPPAEWSAGAVEVSDELAAMAAGLELHLG